MDHLPTLTCFAGLREWRWQTIVCAVLLKATGNHLCTGHLLATNTVRLIKDATGGIHEYWYATIEFH